MATSSRFLPEWEPGGWQGQEAFRQSTLYASMRHVQM